MSVLFKVFYKACAKKDHESMNAFMKFIDIEDTKKVYFYMCSAHNYDSEIIMMINFYKSCENTIEVHGIINNGFISAKRSDNTRYMKIMLEMEPRLYNVYVMCSNTFNILIFKMIAIHFKNDEERYKKILGHIDNYASKLPFYQFFYNASGKKSLLLPVELVRLLSNF